jgi:hypothetical protein
METSAPVDLKKVRKRRKKKPEEPAPTQTPPEEVPVEAEVPAVAEPVGVAAGGDGGGASGGVIDGAAPTTTDELEEPQSPTIDASETEQSETVDTAEVNEAPAEDTLETATPIAADAADAFEDDAVEDETDADPIIPVGPQNVPRPVKLQGPRVIRVEKPDPLPPPRRPRMRQAGLPGAPAAQGPMAPGAPGPAGAGRGKTRSKTYQSEDQKKKRAGRTRRGSEAQTGELIREWKAGQRRSRIRRIQSHYLGPGHRTDHPQGVLCRNRAVALTADAQDAQRSQDHSEHQHDAGQRDRCPARQ